MAADTKKIPAPKAPEDDKAHHALDARLVLRLAAFLKPYTWPSVVCFIITIVVAGLRLLQPALIHQIIETKVAAHDLPGLARASALLFALIIAVLGLDITFNYMTGIIGQRSMHDLRMAILRHVDELDVAFFDRTPVGRLITRMTSDVSSLSDLFTTGVIAIFAEMMMLAGLIGLMMYYSLRLTLVVLCAAPFMLVTVWLFRKHSRKWYLEVRSRLAMMNSFLQENIAGMATVQSFNREPRNREKFYGQNDSYRRAQIETILAFALFFPALNVILSLTLASVIWVGGRSVLEGSFLGGDPISFATLFLFVQCVNMLFTPLRNLTEKYNVLQSAMASSARIFSLLDTPARIMPPEHPKPLTDFRHSIQFENVSFEYVEGEPVLHGVSFEIPRGKTVAVVGATGSGKSTLVNLLTRFYDVKGGRILVDGVDVRDADLRGLRNLFAVVLQEVFLFSDTIAGNIRLANGELSDKAIRELLRQVRAEDFVDALPGGIYAPVRERGGGFSTGQKQLLAFARALASDPKVLILDEATANVDTETEQRIQEAIGRLLEGRTALVIAHRISTIQKADRIIVMHKGKIRESGTHAQLIASDGLYRRLYEMQYRRESVDEEAPEGATPEPAAS